MQPRSAIWIACSFFVVVILFWVVLRHFGVYGDPARVDAAFVGVFGTVIAAVGAVFLWQVQHNTELDKNQQLVSEKQLRLLLALRAELILNLKALVAQTAGADAQILKTHLRRQLNNSGLLPKSISSKTNDVFEHAKQQIAELPATVLPYIVEYYQREEYVFRINTSMSSGEFDDLELDRKAHFWKLCSNRVFQQLRQHWLPFSL